MKKIIKDYNFENELKIIFVDDDKWYRIVGKARDYTSQVEENVGGEFEVRIEGPEIHYLRLIRKQNQEETIVEGATLGLAIKESNRMHLWEYERRLKKNPEYVTNKEEWAKDVLDGAEKLILEMKKKKMT
jgi:hypothetical protein